jgi:hypothetical protein
MKKKDARGGKRTGAGRPRLSPEGSGAYNVRLEKSTLLRLAALPHGAASVLIRKAISAALDKWDKDAEARGRAEYERLKAIYEPRTNKRPK